MLDVSKAIRFLGDMPKSFLFKEAKICNVRVNDDMCKNEIILLLCKPVTMPNVDGGFDTVVPVENMMTEYERTG